MSIIFTVTNKCPRGFPEVGSWGSHPRVVNVTRKGWRKYAKQYIFKNNPKSVYVHKHPDFEQLHLRTVKFLLHLKKGRKKKFRVRDFTEYTLVLPKNLLAIVLTYLVGTEEYAVSGFCSVVRDKDIEKRCAQMMTLDPRVNHKMFFSKVYENNVSKYRAMAQYGSVDLVRYFIKGSIFDDKSQLYIKAFEAGAEYRHKHVVTHSLDNVYRIDDDYREDFERGCMFVAVNGWVEEFERVVELLREDEIHNIVGRLLMEEFNRSGLPPDYEMKEGEEDIVRDGWYKIYDIILGLPKDKFPGVFDQVVDAFEHRPRMCLLNKLLERGYKPLYKKVCRHKRYGEWVFEQEFAKEFIDVCPDIMDIHPRYEVYDQPSRNIDHLVAVVFSSDLEFVGFLLQKGIIFPSNVVVHILNLAGILGKWDHPVCCRLLRQLKE